MKTLLHSLLVLLCLALAACGNKGPLVLPEDPEEQAVPAAPEEDAAAAADAPVDAADPEAVPEPPPVDDGAADPAVPEPPPQDDGSDG